MKNFLKINPTDLKDNTFSLIGSDWALLTAGPTNDYNTMTVSWGGLGVLWNKNVAFVFVRPERHTYQFTEKNDFFTLSFFTDAYKPALSLCGTKSGRDIDKAKEAGISPISIGEDSTAFEEARIVLKCKKLYAQDLDTSCVIEPSILDTYKNDGVHKMYVGEIVEAYICE